MRAILDEQLSPQIAALLGCREASVRSLASRGLAVLRQLAVPAGIGEDDRR
mgnify:CR=1 FL=1